MCEKSEGFNYYFDATKCEVCDGKCCTGESGYIWIDEFEISRLSAFLKLEVGEVKKQFLDKFGARYSIKERKFESGYACLFFDEQKRRCGIYEFRPKQCRTFPFWDYFKRNFDELERECIGVKPL